jgi:pectate lyase
MKFFAIAALASLAHVASAVGVVGKAEGFATGVTGGGNATPQYPKDINELSKLLTDSTARVIVLDKTFDYTTSEGTVTGAACKFETLVDCNHYINRSRCKLGNWTKVPANLVGCLQCGSGEGDRHLLQSCENHSCQQSSQSI